MAHLPMPTALPLCQALRAHALWESSSAAPVRAASLWLLIVLLEAPVHSAPFCDSVGPLAAVELFAYAAQQPPPPLRAAALFGLQRATAQDATARRQLSSRAHSAGFLRVIVRGRPVPEGLAALHVLLNVSSEPGTSPPSVALLSPSPIPVSPTLPLSPASRAPMAAACLIPLLELAGGRGPFVGRHEDERQYAIGVLANLAKDKKAAVRTTARPVAPIPTTTHPPLTIAPPGHHVHGAAPAGLRNQPGTHRGGKRLHRDG